MMYRLQECADKDSFMLQTLQETYGGGCWTEFITEIPGPYFSLAVDAISAAMDDDEKYVEWFVFECDFGRINFNPDVRTPEDLYDLING